MHVLSRGDCVPICHSICCGRPVHRDLPECGWRRLTDTVMNQSYRLFRSFVSLQRDTVPLVFGQVAPEPKFALRLTISPVVTCNTTRLAVLSAAPPVHNANTPSHTHCTLLAFLSRPPVPNAPPNTASGTVYVATCLRSMPQLIGCLNTVLRHRSCAATAGADRPARMEHRM